MPSTKLVGVQGSEVHQHVIPAHRNRDDGWLGCVLDARQLCAQDVFRGGTVGGQVTKRKIRMTSAQVAAEERRSTDVRHAGLELGIPVD